MINRSNQNWPTDETYELTVCNAGGDDSGLDRRNDLRDVKQAPYAHELNGSGTQCAVDCSACTWVKFNSEVR